MKPIASISLDLDNQWSYMKTHGDAGWQKFPSYLDLAVPRILSFLKERDLTITFFIVGQDAALEKNHAAIRSIADAGHEIANHSLITNLGCTCIPVKNWSRNSKKRRMLWKMLPAFVRSDFAAPDSAFHRPF